MTIGTRLFVGNVNPEVGKEELRDLFAAVGEVVAISTPIDRETKVRRGFAFVEFATPEQAERALETLDESELEGRRIRLKWAYENKVHPDRDDRRGRPRKPDFEDDDDDGRGRYRRREQGSEDEWAESRGKARKRGKHGSDRRRGRGTRRIIE